MAKGTVEITKPGDHFIKPTPPYYSQFASRELVSDILNKKIKADNDPQWRRLFQFKKKEDYVFWSWRLCGLVCVKMVLDSYQKATDQTVASLTETGVKLGGYDIKKDTGWFSAPLVKLAKKFGLTGKVHRVLSVDEIAQNIIRNRFIIASVNPSVIRRDIDTVPDSEKGGHLVLVCGVRIADGKIAGFYINNPSGRTPSTQQKAFIPIVQFNNAFGKRGFSLYRR
jgi:hypothetical protein